VPTVVNAWRATGAFEQGAELQFVVDADDPAEDEYLNAFDLFAGSPDAQASMHFAPSWLPLVPKLNRRAARLASHHHYALAFMGDDHLPRTRGWVGRYLTELREMRTGIVYGNDGFQGAKLPTQWAMTADIVRALGRMVPADVEHMYCDNSVMDLGRAAGCLRYLPDVLVEHMHPFAGKGKLDDGYRRVNQAAQYERDQRAYLRWRSTQLAMDAGIVRTLREKEMARG
jgi:hypothetical protein